MDAGLLWLFFFAALAIGWALGYLSKARPEKEDDPHYPQKPHLKHRLQLLFDSYSDDSIDGFVKSLEVNNDTLPIHLSIGKHFRREGEVEKAILIHQNLMARPELSDDQTDPVVYELAKDYKAAGLFDRAEALLEQLMESKRFAPKSVGLLLDILENEKDWERALELSSHPSVKKSPENTKRLAQYCCELAERKLRERDLHQAKQLIKRALSYDKFGFRTNLLQAKLDVENFRYKHAVSNLRKIGERDPGRILLTLPLLEKCAEASGTHDKLRDYLAKAFEETAQIELLLALVSSYKENGETDSAYEVLNEKMREMPSLIGLNALIKQRLESEEAHEREDLLVIVEKVLTKLVGERASYQCDQCGFSSQKMYWLCPSCKQWETVKPLVEYGSKV